MLLCFISFVENDTTMDHNLNPLKIVIQKPMSVSVKPTEPCLSCFFPSGIQSNNNLLVLLISLVCYSFAIQMFLSEKCYKHNALHSSNIF